MSETTLFEIIWCSFNLIFSASQAMFMCANLTPKLNKYLTCAVATVPFCALALLQRAIPEKYATLTVAAAMIYYFLSAILLFRDKLSKRLVVPALLFGVTLLHSAVSSLINAFLGIEAEPNIYGQFVVFLIFIPIFAVLLIITNAHRRKHEQISMPAKGFAAFIIVPMSQIIMVSASVPILLDIKRWYIPAWLQNTVGGERNVTILFLAAASLLCVFADAMLYFVLVRSAQSDRLREELRFLDYQNKLNLEYYKSVEENALEMRKIRHDMANVLQVSYHILEGDTEESRENAEKLLNQLSRSIDDIHLERFCENALLNAIASTKSEDCRRQNIEYGFDLRIPASLGIEEIDLCKVFVNILDNAINAAALSKEEKYIRLSAFCEEETLYITCENSTTTDGADVQRRSGKDHGLGLKILNDTAGKYNGRAIHKADNGRFYTTVSMQLRQA